MVFSIIGFMAHGQNKPIEEVAESGTVVTPGGLNSLIPAGYLPPVRTWTGVSGLPLCHAEDALFARLGDALLHDDHHARSRQPVLYHGGIFYGSHRRMALLPSPPQRTVHSLCVFHLLPDWLGVRSSGKPKRCHW